MSGIPVEPAEEKILPSFHLDAEDHPMVQGMHPGNVYHMKVKARMVSKEIMKDKGKEKHHGRFEIMDAEEHGNESYKDILKDGAHEESKPHEKHESKHKESQEGE